MDKEGYSFHSILLKPQIFIPSKNWEELERMKLDLMNFFTKILKIVLYN